MKIYVVSMASAKEVAVLPSNPLIMTFCFIRYQQHKERSQQAHQEGQSDCIYRQVKINRIPSPQRTSSLSSLQESPLRIIFVSFLLQSSFFPAIFLFLGVFPADFIFLRSMHLSFVFHKLTVQWGFGLNF